MRLAFHWGALREALLVLQGSHPEMLELISAAIAGAMQRNKFSEVVGGLRKAGQSLVISDPTAGETLFTCAEMIAVAVEGRS